MYKNVVCLKGRVARFDVRSYLTSNAFGAYLNEKKGFIDDINKTTSYKVEPWTHTHHPSVSHGAWHPTYYTVYLYKQSVYKMLITDEDLRHLVSISTLDMRTTALMVLTFNNCNYCVVVKSGDRHNEWSLKVKELVPDEKSSILEGALFNGTAIACEMMIHGISNFYCTGLIVEEVTTNTYRDVVCKLYEMTSWTWRKEDWSKEFDYVAVYFHKDKHYIRHDFDDFNIIESLEIDVDIASKVTWSYYLSSLELYTPMQPFIPTGSYIITGHLSDNDWNQARHLGGLNDDQYPELDIFDHLVHDYSYDEENDSVDENFPPIHHLENYVSDHSLSYCYLNNCLNPMDDVGAGTFYKLSNAEPLHLTWEDDIRVVFNGMFTPNFCITDLTKDLIYVDEFKEFAMVSNKILEI